MGAGLIRQEVGDDLAFRERGDDRCCVSHQADGACLSLRLVVLDQAEGFVQVLNHLIKVSSLESALQPGRVHFDDQDRRPVHRAREGLRTTHAPAATRDDEPATQVPLKVLPCSLGEGLIGSLEDPLRPDVHPGPGGHLPEHDEPGPFIFKEAFPGRPPGDEIGVRDQDTRGVRVRAKDTHRLAGLDQEGLIPFQAFKRADQGVEALPVPGRLSNPPIHDQFFRALRHSRVEVVHEHTQCSLLGPAFTAEGGAAGRMQGAGVVGRGHGLVPCARRHYNTLADVQPRGMQKRSPEIYPPAVTLARKLEDRRWRARL